MWSVFKNAAVRKLAYVLVALLVSALLGKHAHATTYVFPLGAGFTSTAREYCNQHAAIANANSGTVFTITSCSMAGGGCSVAGNPAVAPTSTSCSAVVACSPSGACDSSASAVPGTPPVCSSSSGNVDLMTVVGGSGGYTSGGNYCYNSCEYANGNLAVTFGTAKQRMAGQAVPTGSMCGSATDAVSQAQNCNSSGGTTACVDGAGNRAVVQPTSTGTFSVVNANVPAAVNSCLSYADGGVACNAGPTGTSLTMPPGPSTAVLGTALAPDVQVASVGGNTINYYTPGHAALSKAPIGLANSSNGLPAGTLAATGTGTGTSGTGPSAANGDCAGTGVDCSGDSTLPSLTRSDTIQSDVQDYWNAVQSAPLVAAFASITGSWPTASCPTIPFSISIFHGSPSYDAFAPVCSVWGGTVAPTLSLVFLAMWAVAGIRVVLSA